MRTFTIKGETFQSHLNDTQALAACRGLTSAFARSLVDQAARGRRLSDTQVAWTHKLAVDATRPSEAQFELELGNVFNLFITAGASALRFPKIRLVTMNRTPVVLAWKTDKAKGGMTVMINGEGEKFLRYGMIRNGFLTPGRDMNDQVRDLLLQLDDSPRETIAAYGKLLGRCSFCRLELSDPRSTAVGYGEICANNYGLPWG